MIWRASVRTTPPRPRLRRVLQRSGITALLTLTPLLRAQAQVKEGFDDRSADTTPHTRLDSLAQRHMVHVSPHVLVFDARTKTATVTFSNRSDRPTQADVLVLFAYPDWPHGHPADTTVFTETKMETLLPHDSIVLTPSPKDHFAGRWLSALPARLTLAPHETKRLTLTITPPPNLPPGEYWARVVVIVNSHDPNRQKGARDVRQMYALPIHAAIPQVRDSVLVFYRQGAVHTGLRLGPGAAAAYDPTDMGVGGPDGRDCPRSLWIKLPMHLTGTAHVDGILTVAYLPVGGGGLIQVNRYAIPLYRDEVTHWWAHTCWVPTGTYRAVLRVERDPHALPAAALLPMAPVVDTIKTPFTIER